MFDYAESSFVYYWEIPYKWTHKQRFPYAVRSTLRNDSKGLAKFQLLVKLQLYIIDAPLYCEEKNGRQVQDQA